MSSSPRTATDLLGEACPICGAARLRNEAGKLTNRCSAGHEWWAPNPGPQTRFLASNAEEVLYGGAAGGGKSAALVAYPLRWVHHPHFRALVLRRETTDLGDLLDKTAALYPKVIPGAKFREDKKTWYFPSGARIRYNHCQHEKHARIYDGHEFQLVCFDELTHFTESQYRAIRARIRSAHPGLPRYTRSTTNPGGHGHEWVFRRFGPWLNPKYEGGGLTPRRGPDGSPLPPAEPGEKCWYVTGDRGEDRWVPRGTPDRDGTPAKARCFIPARLEDNPALLQNDPGYAATLRDLDPVRAEQLRNGNWLVRAARGLYFRRTHFAGRIVDAGPSRVLARVRYWDRAASLEGDWTVGLRMSVTEDGLLWVEHIVRFRGDPRTVEETIKTTAAMDGIGVTQCLERDPGSAGVSEVAYLTRSLAGYPVAAFPKRANKIVAAGPVSAQVVAGNARMFRGPWNEEFLSELEEFPEGRFDDQVDALSGAYNVLMGAEAIDEEDGRILVASRSAR